MMKCKNCGAEIEISAARECPDCKAVMCENCGGKTKNICPYCYSTLDYYH